MKKLLTLISMAIASTSVFAAETTKTWEVDYSGKPPFKRTLVEVEVADIAQMETVETQFVRTTDFSGKPPFKRNLETLEVVDTAVLEEADVDTKVSKPGKRHK